MEWINGKKLVTGYEKSVYEQLMGIEKMEQHNVRAAAVAHYAEKSFENFSEGGKGAGEWLPLRAQIEFLQKEIGHKCPYDIYSAIGRAADISYGRMKSVLKGGGL